MRVIRGGLAIVLVWAWMAGCATQQTQEARVRGALDVVARVVDPLYSLAVDGCIAREHLIAGSAERGEVKTADAERMLREVRARCHHLRTSFDQIRAAHAKAAELIERGAVDEARKLLDQIEQAWAEIKDGGLS